MDIVGADFNNLSSIIDISGQLVNESPLRVGGGRGNKFDSAADSPIITMGNIPFIPGSTLKGALRSLAEAYANSMGWKVVYPYEDKENELNDCITCILFGSKNVASRVYLFDSPLKGDVRTGIRTMVAINRVFGAQQPKMLYTLDYIEPNSIFDFKMRIINLDIINGENEEWKKKGVQIMNFLISQLKEGIMIGSRKSTGYGLVKLNDAKYVLKKLDNGEMKIIKEGSL